MESYTRQVSLFDGKKKFKIDKPIRLIELFAGYGSQALALKYLNVPFEHYKICEWAIKSIQAYKDIHFSNDSNDYSKNLTQDEVIEFLANKGISANYNEPMTREQIKRLGEQKQRQIYNNIHATHNLVNIQQAKGSDLKIVDIDKYDYIMTYSFPCQDLSKSGLGKGMAKGSGTRSGMLWEVERILDECNALGGGGLPSILLMENVPDVIGSKNIKHFAKWLEKLESLGYKCYWQVLNAKDFSIPQNRNRCFMVSLLGDYLYEFPKSKKLEIRLKDILEKEVDEKYYLSSKAIEGSLKTNFASSKLENKIPKDGICPTLDTRCDCLGVVVKQQEKYVDKKLAETIKNNNGEIPEFVDLFNARPLKDGIAGTLSTSCGNDCGCGSFAYISNLRIRKLTPKECFRLMGVKEEDFDKVAQNQSNASLYHLAGDSIVVNVLMAIFKQML